jgi:hypothetical protein
LEKLTLSAPGNLCTNLFTITCYLPCLSTLVLNNAEWHPSQLQRWTEFGARVPYLKELSIIKSDGMPQWAQSKLWEEHVPGGFPNLESFEVAGYIVRPRSVARMFARYKTGADYGLKRFRVKDLNWRLLGPKELAGFTNLVEELSAVPQNNLEWSLSDHESYFRLNCAT